MSLLCIFLDLCDICHNIDSVSLYIRYLNQLFHCNIRGTPERIQGHVAILFCSYGAVCSSPLDEKIF
jgi:hypothetical protein